MVTNFAECMGFEDMRRPRGVLSRIVLDAAAAAEGLLLALAPRLSLVDRLHAKA